MDIVGLWILHLNNKDGTNIKGYISDLNAVDSSISWPNIIHINDISSASIKKMKKIDSVTNQVLTEWSVIMVISL